MALPKAHALIDAIIRNDSLAVANITRAEWSSLRDKHGFTLLEIALLLDCRNCLKALGEETDSSFLVCPKGENKPHTVNVRSLEKLFKVQYRSHLVFRSYEELEQVISFCPYSFRIPLIGKENRNWAVLYRQQLSEGFVAPVIIRWIDNILGYGVFAAEDLAEGTYVAEYTGLIRPINEDSPYPGAYCLEYPTSLFSNKTFVVDASRQGNISRFINHSESPNLQTRCVVDRNLLHQVLVTTGRIKKGTQLTCDYGIDYWEKRRMKGNVPLPPQDLAPPP